MITLVARQIWHRRNSMVFGGSFSSPRALLRVAKDQHDVFSMVAKQTGRQSAGYTVKMVIPWQKPPGGTIKVNWDAAVDGRRRRIGMGAIARDSEGSIIAMKCDMVDCICNAPTLLNKRRKWKSPIATKRYYLILDIIRDYKSCNGNSIYKILIKHTKAENQTYILNKSVPCTLHTKKPY
jgi:hypothetical protein